MVNGLIVDKMAQTWLNRVPQRGQTEINKGKRGEMRINWDRHVQTDKPWINWRKDGKRGIRLINWRGKSCFLIQILVQFLRLLQQPLLDIRLKRRRLPNFNMLFQYMLANFFKTELFSCLPFPSSPSRPHLSPALACGVSLPPTEPWESPGRRQ